MCVIFFAALSSRHSRSVYFNDLTVHWSVVKRAIFSVICKFQSCKDAFSKKPTGMYDLFASLALDLFTKLVAVVRLTKDDEAFAKFNEVICRL